MFNIHKCVAACVCACVCVCECWTYLDFLPLLAQMMTQRPKKLFCSKNVLFRQHQTTFENRSNRQKRLPVVWRDELQSPTTSLPWPFWEHCAPLSQPANGSAAICTTKQGNIGTLFSLIKERKQQAAQIRLAVHAETTTTAASWQTVFACRMDILGLGLLQINDWILLLVFLLTTAYLWVFQTLLRACLAIEGKCTAWYALLTSRYLTWNFGYFTKRGIAGPKPKLLIGTVEKVMVF